MAKKKRSSRQRRSRKDLSNDLWISPHLSFRGRDGDRAWNTAGNLTPGAGARFLELADIALGTKKTGQKKKAAGMMVRDTTKDEPDLREGASWSSISTLPLAHGAPEFSPFSRNPIRDKASQNGGQGKQVGARHEKRFEP